MKTLEEIKEEVLGEVRDSEYLESHYNDEVSRRYAIEVAKESLKNANRNLVILGGDNCRCGIEIVYESILNESNIPNLE